MGDLAWKKRSLFYYPKKALRHHAVILGNTGSGKSVTLMRTAYGARKVNRMQVVYLDAKGETKREDEASQDNAALFVAAMQAAGARTVYVFPSLYYNGWQGTATEIKNRLLSVIDYSESAYYGDVAANVLDLALNTPTTPRSSSHFLANLKLDRLKAIYKNDPIQYRRVLELDKHLLEQVKMRYQVFFDAMTGQLDGTLDYANADAVYLRVRGFTLRNEAPRLGRFLVVDFMHYIAERRRPGVQTLFIIDEFNALRMREETSLLFEQVRSFGGNLMISAQGYAGLGPTEYAERILDACSTHIMHSCSDPEPVTRRAGKKLSIDISYTEDEEGIPRRHIKPRWDWRIPPTAVIQQEEGQAFWSYKGRSQHVMTAPVPILPEQVMEGWREIRRQEDIQRQLLEVEARRRAEAAKQKQPRTSSSSPDPNETPSSNANAKSSPRPGSKKNSNKSTERKKGKQQQNTAKGPSSPPAPAQPPPASEKTTRPPAPPVTPPSSAPPPVPDPDDDEPDTL
jgi:hypothetical protein